MCGRAGSVGSPPDTYVRVAQGGSIVFLLVVVVCGCPAKNNVQRPRGRLFVLPTSKALRILRKVEARNCPLPPNLLRYRPSFAAVAAAAVLVLVVSFSRLFLGLDRSGQASLSFFVCAEEARLVHYLTQSARRVLMCWSAL